MNYRTIIKSVVLYSGYLLHRNNKSKVIFYHDVGLKYTDMGTPFETIKSHINLIRKNGFDIVNTIDEKQNQIMICFDDGWSGLYDAKEYFNKEGIHPTVFIAVDLIGSEGHMTAEQIKELASEGFIFQAHTWSHDDLTKCDEVGLQKELVEAKKEMEEMLLLKFNSICFPQGYYNQKVIKASINAGYKHLYSSIWGGYYDKVNEGIICRNLAQDISSKDIKYVIKGSSPFFTSRYSKQHYKE